MPDRPLLILFGSQTGTAEEVADRLAAESLRWHFAPRVVPMEEYDVARLPGEPFVVCVASTTGEGEVPDGMRPLWSFLLRRDLPPGSLRGVRHAVFGLGDSSYAKFNFAAKRLARRLAQLGSPALVPLGLGDDQEALGLDQALGPWAQSLWEALAAALPLPAGRPPLPEGLPPPPRYSVEVLPASSASTPAAPAAAATGPPGPRAPHMARVLANEALTAGSGGGREVRHIEFDIGGSGMEYAAGDALAVQPRNERGATLQLLADLGLDPAQRVRITRAQPHAPPLPRDEWTVLELFEERLDAFGVPRARSARCSRHATGPGARAPSPSLGPRKAPGSSGYTSASRGGRPPRCSPTFGRRARRSPPTSICCRRCATATSRSHRRRFSTRRRSTCASPSCATARCSPRRAAASARISSPPSNPTATPVSASGSARAACGCRRRRRRCCC